ncbi:MAG: hypothetical protein H0X24_13410 [Ktedonobacterales bacterium]|nr:hypothetical protein [Ktedonobacterales bacterium]
MMGDNAAEALPHVIMQTTVPLPMLGGELPLLVTGDQRGYVPVAALCHLMGVRPATYLSRWQRAPFWSEALKLMWQTPTRGRRAVWCLERHSLKDAMQSIDWRGIDPERREQLFAFSQEYEKLLQESYAGLLEEYRAFRRMLYRLLTTYARIAERLQSFRERLGLLLSRHAMDQVGAVLDEGERIISAGADFAATHVRAIEVADTLQTLARGSQDANVTEVTIPSISRADFDALTQHLDRFSAWQDRFDAFLQRYGIS